MEKLTEEEKRSLIIKPVITENLRRIITSDFDKLDKDGKIYNNPQNRRGQ